VATAHIAAHMIGFPQQNQKLDGSSLQVVERVTVHAMSVQNSCCCRCTSPWVIHRSAPPCSAPGDAVTPVGIS
jgi:hypothetical protein